MKSVRRALGLGLLMWLVPFVVAFIVFPFRESWRALFESVMAVTVCATAVGLGLFYLRKLESIEVRDGLLVGLLWWVMSVLIDLPMFFGGPIEITVADYFADIGLTYVAIPAVTTGLAVAARSGARRGAGD